MGDVIRQRLNDGIVGFWLTLPSTVSAEKVALLGYDFVGIDLQHGQTDYGDALAILGALGAAGGSALARVPANEPWWIGRLLDAGAQGIIVPMINDADEARRAVAACRYPPLGERSYGPLRSGMYVGPDPEVANAVICCIALIETARGLANVEAIAAVEGLDALYVGPSDLAISLGLKPGADGNPEFEAGLERIRLAGRNAGIAVGIHCGTGQAARRRLDQGFTFVVAASDLGTIVAGASAELAAARPHSLTPAAAAIGTYSEAPPSKGPAAVPGRPVATQPGQRP